MTSCQQLQLVADWHQFTQLIDATIQCLLSKRDHRESSVYFMSTFIQYMQTVQPAAEAFETKYADLLPRHLYSRLKRKLQKRMEDGLDTFHFCLHHT